MKYEAYSDEELIVKLREGDGDIIDYLIEKYKPLVRKKTNAMYLIGGENEDLLNALTGDLLGALGSLMG